MKFYRRCARYPARSERDCSIDGAPRGCAKQVVQPGPPMTGLFVFELSEDVIRYMKLVLSEQYDPQLKDEISV